MADDIKLHDGDQITVKHSPFVWTVTARRPDGTVKARNSNGRRAMFVPTDVLAIVQRKDQVT